MTIFGSLKKSLEEMAERRREKAFKELLDDTEDIESAISDAIGKASKKTTDDPLKEHFDALNIKRTSDKVKIRKAYLEQIKKYHPDVSEEKNAAEMSKKLNDAYHVLAGKQLATDYESLRTEGKLNPNIKIDMANALLAAYVQKREQDYEELMVQVGYHPVEMPILIAAVQEFTNWKKRYNSVADGLFNGFFRIEPKLEKLEKEDKALYKSERDPQKRKTLEQTAEKLKAAKEEFAELKDDILHVIESVRNDIGPQEQKAGQQMKRSIGI